MVVFYKIYKNYLINMALPRIELGHYPRQGYGLPLAYRARKIQNDFIFNYFSSNKNLSNLINYLLS